MTNEKAPPIFKSSVARIPELDEGAAEAFRAAGIPLSDCLSCASNCDDPADAPSAESSSDIAPKLLKAWSKQSIDTTSDLLGSNKPFASHLLVSTNKKDWQHDAAEEEEGKGVLGLLSRCKWDEGASESAAAAATASRGAQNAKSSGWKSRLGLGNASRRTAAQGEGDGQRASKALPASVWTTTTKTEQRQGRKDAPKRHVTTACSSISTSTEQGWESIMRFPDWTLVDGVPSTSALARLKDSHNTASSSSSSSSSSRAQATMQLIYTRWLSSTPSWTSRQQQEWRDLRIKSQRWVMPFRAVVLLCSHKKRDVRCSLAAEMLSQHFQTLADEKGWKVDMRADEVGLGGGGGGGRRRTREEEMSETVLQLAPDGVREGRGWGYVDEMLGEQQQEEQVRAWRRRAAKGDDELPGRSALGKQERERDDDDDDDDDGTGTLGLFFCSHIGGHKFSGNVIIYFPNGAGVWYGRIDPTTLKDARLVFEETIERGNVVGRFLRGGMNLVRQRDDEQEEQMHSDRGHAQANDDATIHAPCAKGAGILAW